jgi:hypothetical protein
MMQKNPEQRAYVWVLAVILLLVLGAIPVAWAGPLAQPARQTVPAPITPTPTPFIIIEDDPVEPGQPVDKTITIRNERDNPMVGCVIRISEVVGLEYLIDGQVLSPPYEFQLGTIEPGQQTVFEIEIRLTEDAQPCVEYVMEITIECEGEEPVMRTNPILTPCPILPEVGE